MTLMRFDRWLYRLLALLLLAGMGSVLAVPAGLGETPPPSGDPVLAQAFMCETVQGSTPIQPAVAFAATIGKVTCFSLFDPVPERAVVYHAWYHRDVLSATRKLTLKPLRWAAFSSIQLRESDKGPWRVEVQDEQGRVMHTLRFSIVD
jgi:hypothetical protein